MGRPGLLFLASEKRNYLICSFFFQKLGVKTNFLLPLLSKSIFSKVFPFFGTLSRFIEAFLK